MSCGVLWRVAAVLGFGMIEWGVCGGWCVGCCSCVVGVLMVKVCVGRG